MHFFKYIPLVLATLSVAAPASKTKAKANANTIIADIDVIQQKNQALQDALVPFQGGLFGLFDALKISGLGNDVKKALTQTINDAKASAPFTDQEAINIGVKVNDLNPNVIKTLDVFKTKRQAFDNPFRLSGIVKSTLQDQKKTTKQLADAITAKVPEALRAIAGQFSDPVLAKFDEVIAAYS